MTINCEQLFSVLTNVELVVLGVVMMFLSKIEIIVTYDLLSSQIKL